MTAVFFLLRANWKPVVAVMIALFIYNAGYRSATRVCNTANLSAEIIELKRQNTANENILAQAEKDRLLRDSEITNLTKKVDDYEKDIGKQNACILSPVDAERLRAIR